MDKVFFQKLVEKINRDWEEKGEWFGYYDKYYDKTQPQNKINKDIFFHLSKLDKGISGLLALIRHLQCQIEEMQK